MTLNEFLKQFDGNLFDEIQKVQSFPFLGKDNQTLQQLLLVNGGKRSVIESITTLSLPTVASIIIYDFGDLWSDLSGLGLSLDGSLADELRITNTKSNGAIEQSNNINTLNKVSAYDSDELIADEGSASTGKNDTKNKDESNTRDELYRFGTIYENLDTAQQLKIHRKVIKDILNTITLKVYQ